MSSDAFACSAHIPYAGPAGPSEPPSRVKVVDPSSNPYVATAAVLGLALHGLGKRFVPPGGDPD